MRCLVSKVWALREAALTKARLRLKEFEAEHGAERGEAAHKAGTEPHLHNEAAVNNRAQAKRADERRDEESDEENHRG